MEDFLYGAGYYPLMHPREDWKRDLDYMQQCGINIIRTAELFNTWDRIEPVRGQFEFGFLDDFFDECQKRGIRILLGTGTASPPYWLHELDPEINIRSASGRQYPNHVTYSWACFHNPVYLRESERYIRTLVERYKNHPALYAYQIHNEIGLPFMQIDGNGMEMYCYCRHSKEQFRIWLKNKYQTLDALNQAWTWSATNCVCTAWEQVEPPYAKPVSWSSMTRYLDFRLFMMDSITAFVGWQHRMIKEMDPLHLTSTNIFYMKGEDKMSVMTAIDQFSIAKEVDVIGYDLYPGSGDKLENRPEFSSMFLDHAASVSRPLGRPFWLLEVESGPINGWAMGPHRNTSPDDIYRYIMEAVGHGAKFTLYQGYRQWDFQALNWGGLVDLDGNWTPRCDAAKQAGDFVTRNGGFLNTAKVEKGQAALLVSRENAVIANGMGHENQLVRAISAAYRVFWELGYRVDFITPELLQSGWGDSYDVIAAPFLLSVSRTLAERLSEYAKNGGIVVGMTRFSYVDEKGWYNRQAPAGEAQKLFGIRSSSVERSQAPEITYRRRNYAGCSHKENLEVVSGRAVVKARFFDDSPAVVINRYGDGLGVYFATHADAAFLENHSCLYADVMEDLLKDAGIRPQAEVSYSNRLDREIDCHLLRGRNMDMVLITVFCKKDRPALFVNDRKLAEFSLSVSGTPKEIRHEATGEQAAFVYKNGRVDFSLSLEYQGKHCLLIIKEKTDSAEIAKEE